MKTSHKFTPYLTILLFLLSIGLIDTIGFFKIPIAAAPVVASVSAGSPRSSPAFIAINSSINSSTSIDSLITWKDLVSFLEKDHTNWNKYVPGKYTCLEFSMDLVTNARKQGIKAWIVTVEFAAGGPGHAFVAIDTRDRGTVYIEPQADDPYPLVKIGDPLCDAWGVYQCMGKVSTIDYVQCANANYCTKYIP